MFASSDNDGDGQINVVEFMQGFSDLLNIPLDRKVRPTVHAVPTCPQCARRVPSTLRSKSTPASVRDVTVCPWCTLHESPP